MLFNSYGFIFLYLPIVLGVFFWLARFSHKYSAAWLVLASLFFYGFWNPVYVWLLLASAIGNYLFGRWIADAQKAANIARRKHLLVMSISANLALLGYYKYANFFVDNVNRLAGTELLLGTILLPLGISFFTFTQIAFLVDASQGKAREYSFIHYALFVTYFPHLIAGPILHHKEMMPQFAERGNYQIKWDNMATGLMLFTLGLCKKTLWADSLAPFVDAIFDGVERNQIPTLYEAWCGALAYTMQIYFDFSGYTDMALGIALMFNIRLPVNFFAPYKARSIIDFWRRWHMTLSRFLRDYLYIPLGGNRKGPLRRYRNLLITMLLGGLWHGAAWTFVCWGGLHGLYLALNHLWHDWRSGRSQFYVPTWLAGLITGFVTFTAVVMGWVIFRSTDLMHAWMMIKAMTGIDARPISFWDVTHGQLLLSTNLRGRELANLLIAAMAWVWLLPNSTRLRFVSGNILLVLAEVITVCFFLFLAIDHLGSYSPFLYFQF